eukprot:scaffold20158_cov45-Phaeocystis_antarctica.AAC.1
MSKDKRTCTPPHRARTLTRRPRPGQDARLAEPRQVCYSHVRASPWADRNAKGEGKLFNVLVADHTGDIRMTGFNETLD